MSDTQKTSKEERLTPEELLRISARDGDGTLTIAPHGEIDCYTLPILEEVFRGDFSDKSAVVVDLTETLFMDCRAVRCLAGFARQMEKAEIPLSIRAIKDTPPHRILEVLTHAGFKVAPFESINRA